MTEKGKKKGLALGVAITASLLADELLVEEGPSSGRDSGRDGAGPVGRPASLLRVDPQARHVVGVKLAPESLTATVTDLDAEPMAMVTLPHGTQATLDEIVELLGSAIDDLCAEAGLGHERPLGIGVGLPGGVDPDSGTVVRSPLPAWVGQDLAGTLEQRLGLPVLIDNDVNTLTVAEHLYGAGRGVDHLLVVTIGRGIGICAVIDGAIARGARGALGEIGHVTAVPDGRECWCGQRGCLEAEAAEPAIARLRDGSISYVGTNSCIPSSTTGFTAATCIRWVCPPATSASVDCPGSELPRTNAAQPPGWAFFMTR